MIFSQTSITNNTVYNVECLKPAGSPLIYCCHGNNFAITTVKYRSASLTS